MDSGILSSPVVNCKTYGFAGNSGILLAFLRNCGRDAFAPRGFAIHPLKTVKVYG